MAISALNKMKELAASELTASELDLSRLFDSQLAQFTRFQLGCGVALGDFIGRV